MTRRAEKWEFPLAWPLGNFHVKNAQIFADKVKEVTQGEVQITVHPGAALGYKGPEMLGAVRDGLVPIGDILLNQQVGEESFLGIESVPYLASGFVELRALQTFSRPVYEKIARKQASLRRAGQQVDDYLLRHANDCRMANTF